MKNKWRLGVEGRAGFRVLQLVLTAPTTNKVHCTLTILIISPSPFPLVYFPSTIFLLSSLLLIIHSPHNPLSSIFSSQFFYQCTSYSPHLNRLPTTLLNHLYYANYATYLSTHNAYYRLPNSPSHTGAQCVSPPISASLLSNA